MVDTLCSWKKVEIKRKRLLKIVGQPQYFCKECGRAANKKKYLCDPKKLHKNQIS